MVLYFEELKVESTIYFSRELKARRTTKANKNKFLKKKVEKEQILCRNPQTDKFQQKKMGAWQVFISSFLARIL